MKIYFNVSAIWMAIAGLMIWMYELSLYIRKEQINFFGNTEFAPLMMTAFGGGCISVLFKPANRKIPEGLLKPKPSIWSGSAVKIYNSLRESFNTQALQSSAQGIADWQPDEEDPEKKILKYKRSVLDYSDELTSPGVMMGEMKLTITLCEKDNTTEATIQYSTSEGMIAFTAAKIIHETNARINQAKAKVS